MLRVPTPAQADALLADANDRNPGLWSDHSRVVADCARRIAEKCPDMDPDVAYAAGLLHDVGRREGPKALQHVLDGYHYLMGLGYTDAARICITHSFPDASLDSYIGQRDCTPEDLSFIKNYLAQTPFDDYDRLVQLGDALGLPSGPVLMEKRLLDVVMRHGVPEGILTKWRAFLDLRDHFNRKVGGSIYDLLPRVVENTFA